MICIRQGLRKYQYKDKHKDKYNDKYKYKNKQQTYDVICFWKALCAPPTESPRYVGTRNICKITPVSRNLYHI